MSRRTRLSALLAYLASAGHPSIALTWHAPVWTGRPRQRRPVRYSKEGGQHPTLPPVRRARRNVVPAL